VKNKTPLAVIRWLALKARHLNKSGWVRMVARSLNARKIQIQTQIQIQIQIQTQIQIQIQTQTQIQIQIQMVMAEAAEAAEAAEETRQGLHDANHHANQPKYPFLESQDHRNALRTEQLLRILPPMDSQ
jgi:hypothetical protein